MTILITGASGKLGSELVKLLPQALTPSHYEMDLTCYMDIKNYFIKHQPIDIVIHLGALTTIHACEQDKELAWKINVEGTRNLMNIAYAWNNNVYLVYASTPCVFSGNKQGTYKENDEPNPKNYYGLTKLIAEYITLYTSHRSLVFRSNFIPFKKYQYSKAFTDRYGTYLFTHQVCKALIELLDNKTTGIVHIVGNKKLSMLELAHLCPDSQEVQPMTINDYEGIGKLTMNMCMDTITGLKRYDINKIN